MIQAYKDFWKRYADFNGKSTRSEFWYPVLINFLIIFGSLLIVIIGSASMYGKVVVSNELEQNVGVSGFSIFLVILLFLSAIYGIAAIVPNIAMAVRRLRDANLPWALIFLGFIPFFGGIVLLVLFCQPSVNQPTNNTETDEMS